MAAYRTSLAAAALLVTALLLGPVAVRTFVPSLPPQGAPPAAVTVDGQHPSMRGAAGERGLYAAPFAASALAAAAAVAAATALLRAPRAAAAAPSNNGSSVVALRAFENETGIQAPVGYWDPLGLASDGLQSQFNRRREVELKHGRLSMAATIGYIWPEYYKFPGFLSPSMNMKFSDVPNGLAALAKISPLGIFQIVLFAGLVELNIYSESNQVKGDPGNYGAGFLGLRSVGIMSSIADPEVRKKKLNAELANGRLAMMAIIGMFFQDGLTGSAWGDWSLYTDSPIR